MVTPEEEVKKAEALHPNSPPAEVITPLLQVPRLEAERLVAVVVAKVEVPATDSVPEKDGEEDTAKEMVPAVEVDQTILLPFCRVLTPQVLPVEAIICPAWVGAVVVAVPPEPMAKGWVRVRLVMVVLAKVEVPVTVKLVMVVVAKVEVPVTPSVPEKEGELVTLIVPEEVEVETEILVPAKIL